LFLAFAFAFAACGGDDAGSAPVPDAAAGPGTVAETGAPPADGGASGLPRVERATGTHLVAAAATLGGLTSDGFVIYSEGGSDGGGLATAKAISLDGGDPVSIATSNGTGKSDLRFEVHGRVAFVWADRGNRSANLTIWSQATGVIPVGPSVRPGRAAATADGQHVIFIRDVTDPSASVVAGPIAGPYSVIGTMSAVDDCWRNADLEAAGPAPGRLFARFCHPGSTEFLLRSVALDGSPSVDLTTSAAAVTYGKTRVIWRETSGALKSAAPDGTGTVALAPTAADATIAPGDSAVFYLTSDGAITRTSIDGGAPTAIVAAGGAKLLGAAGPGGDRVLFASDVDDRGTGYVGPYTDVKLALAASDGGVSTSPLVSTKTSCPVCLNDAFSADGTVALALDPVDNSVAAGGVGPLRAFDVATGAPLTTVGTRVYTTVALPTDAGTRFLVVDATPDTALASGFAFGLTTQNPAQNGAPSEISVGVEALTVDATRAHVVYSFATSSPLAGIWVGTLE
jgi:hypothetical protein